MKSSSALSSAASAAQEARPQDASRWKAALGEAQYFAGGLISKASESSRHYTVIRHSRALVWYRGPTTSVAITILSDRTLPPDRSIWLQEKGFSGNMGMSLKAMVGTTAGWINVTPAHEATSANLPEADERGIQRDLKRFSKKASGRAKSHIPRETHVVRIPATATDGYFRLVVTHGEDSKSTICGSPVFRIASTSSDAAIVRGAGLKTLPLEVGVKVVSTVGQQVIKRYTGVVGQVVQSRAAQAIPSKAFRAAGTAYRGYQVSGAGTAMQESWRNGKAGRFEAMVSPVHPGTSEPFHIIGADAGPDAPFPLAFEGRVVRGTGISAPDILIPTANLSGVPEHIKTRLSGVFASWARVVPEKNMEDVCDDWHESLVTVAPLRSDAPAIIMKNRVVVTLVHDYHDTTFFDAKIKVILMGYLRPAIIHQDSEITVVQHERDVLTTLASLNRDNWGWEETKYSMTMAKGSRTFNERLDSVTGTAQNGIDKVPLHWAGVRSESGALRDQLYGNGGMWISRN